MTSPTINPSVPAVVFEVVTEIVSGGPEEEEEKGETVEYSENDISDIIDSELGRVLDEEEKKDAEAEALKNESSKQTVVESKDEKKQIEEEEPKGITFGGQPVPDAGTVVINGYANSIQEDNNAQTSSDKPPAPKPPSEIALKRQSSAIPQTDLDTFETITKFENGSTQDLDVSNPDDDTEDKKSDVGSVGTVDSLEKEPALAQESGEPNTVVVARRKKGNIRPRNVSLTACLSFLSLSLVLTGTVVYSLMITTFMADMKYVRL